MPFNPNYNNRKGSEFKVLAALATVSAMEKNIVAEANFNQRATDVVRDLKRRARPDAEDQ
jgi:hypothetical protein